MGLINRLYTFLTGGTIYAAHVNAELDQILTLVNGNLEAANIATSAIGTAELADDSVDKDKIAADVAGAGLVQNVDGSLEINPDDSTVEVATDTLQVKALGIDNSHIATAAAIAITKIANLGDEHNTDGTHKTINSNGNVILEGNLVVQGSGDANIRFSVIAASSQIRLGDGTNVQDIYITHTGTEELTLADAADGNLVKIIAKTADLDVRGNVLTQGNIVAQGSGDANIRVAIITASSQIRLGDGTNAQDVYITHAGTEAINIADAAGGDLVLVDLETAELQVSGDLDINGTGNSTFAGNLVVSGDITLTGKAAGEPVAFSVHKNGTAQTLTTAETTILTWSTELFDTNSDFATNVFTPTVAGKYALTAVARMDVPAGNSVVALTIFKNGVAVNGIEDVLGSYDNQSLVVHAVVDANGTTDYFDVRALQVSGGNLDVLGAAAYTYFCGHRIAFS